jgi:hypothetical protein
MESQLEFPQYLDTLICDDIRQEVNNKLSLIGVYGDKIYVKDFPYTFGKFCAYQSFRGGRGKFTATILFVDSEGKELTRSPEIPLDIPHDEKPRRVVFAVGVGSLKFDKAGTYEIRTALNGKDISKYVFSIEKAPNANEATREK